MSESPVDIVNDAGDAGHGAASSAAPTTPGAVLSATRQGHGLTIEQVASHLNLAPRQVMALEANDFAALPGMVIARGFLRSYAKLLRLDPVALVAMLGEQNQAASSAPMRHALSGSFSESRLPSQSSPGARSKSVPIAAGIALLVAAAAGSYALGWWPEVLSRRVAQLRLSALSNGADVKSEGSAGNDVTVSDAGAGGARTDGGASVLALPTRVSGAALLTTTTTLAGMPLGALTEAPAQPVSIGARSEAATATAGSAGPLPALMPSTGLKLPLQVLAGPGAATPQNPLVLNIQEDSWVEIKRADNTPVISKVIKAGSVETFEVSEPLTLTIGNISGVEASLRGAPIKLASAATGNVARVLIK
ncbi:MAG: helix-turn-helix domain-containing protein [Herminiimonas sp.]|nr:helix-turn-helix domain-containing protein [Herminiimonas sp.]